MTKEDRMALDASQDSAYFNGEFDKVESPVEWHECEKVAFDDWWNARGEHKFTETRHMAAGAAWFARAEAAASAIGAIPQPQNHDQAQARIVECVNEISIIADSFGYDPFEWLASSDSSAKGQP